MGYNPRICVICKYEEDEGWQNTHRCESTLKRLKMTFNEEEAEVERGHWAEKDVCNNCLLRTYAPGTRFECVICRRNSHKSWNNTHLWKLAICRHDVLFPHKAQTLKLQRD